MYSAVKWRKIQNIDDEEHFFTLLSSLIDLEMTKATFRDALGFAGVSKNSACFGNVQYYNVWIILSDFFFYTFLNFSLFFFFSQ